MVLIDSHSPEVYRFKLLANSCQGLEIFFNIAPDILSVCPLKPRLMCASKARTSPSRNPFILTVRVDVSWLGGGGRDYLILS